MRPNLLHDLVRILAVRQCKIGHFIPTCARRFPVIADENRRVLIGLQFFDYVICCRLRCVLYKTKEGVSAGDEEEDAIFPLYPNAG